MAHVRNGWKTDIGELTLSGLPAPTPADGQIGFFASGMFEARVVELEIARFIRATSHDEKSGTIYGTEAPAVS